MSGGRQGFLRRRFRRSCAFEQHALAADGDKLGVWGWSYGGYMTYWVVTHTTRFKAAMSGAGLANLASFYGQSDVQSPWNAMLLVTGAVAMTDALARFGFVEFMGNVVRNLGITPTALPYIAAWSTAVTTNFISGTATAALFCNIFIPAAVEIGYSPASIAILIANVALGLVVPWAGATAVTTFTGGEIEMKQMIRVGIVATIIYTTAVATINLMMAGIV